MLRSSATAGTASIGSQQNITEIIQLLESKNINVIEETSALVRDSLNSSPEPWLLNALVDYYIASGNVLARRLLIGIRQPQHKNLLIKLDEYLQKPTTRYSALNLFGHVVRKDPIWIHHLVKSHAFGIILKFLHQDNDVTLLTNALYVVTTLLPKVPTRIGQNLNLLFGIYVRLVAWKKSKCVAMNEASLTNFEIALYTLFLCLYGMYPCGFVAYLQQNYCKQRAGGDTRATGQSHPSASISAGDQILSRQKYEIFKEIVLPMLRQVRLHPNLILYSKELEVSNEKWRKTECHDVVAEISQIRLDEAEDTPWQNGEKAQFASNKSLVSEDRASDFTVRVNPNDFGGAESHGQLEPSSMIWSPSMEIGLSTPPPSRSISPSRELCEQKAKNESSKVTPALDGQKPRTRPGTLGLSASLLRENSNSTPSTPTQGNFSFEFEKADESSRIDASVSCDSNSVVSTPDLHGRAAADKLPAFHVADTVNDENAAKFSPLHLHAADEEFVDINCDGEESSKSSGITDFSPALQPSLDHSSLTSAPAPSWKEPSAQDSRFVEGDSPSVCDILFSAVPQSLSSLELMQKELELAAESPAPKFSHKETDWVHLLGEMELPALRSSFLQMHCALLHERHRREQHATRARRLMRKVYEFSALEQRNETLQQTLIQKENEVFHLQSMMKCDKAEFRKNEGTLQKTVDGCKERITDLVKDLKAVTAENDRLKLGRDKNLEDLNEAKDNLKSARSELYRCKLQLQCESKNKETIQDLQTQVVQLQKELLIVEELSRTMTTVSQSTNRFKLTEKATFNMKIDSYKREQARLKDTLREKSVMYDATKGKCREMEKLVEKKNLLLVEQKKYLENVKSLARSQIQAMESKYQAQKSITMRMEAQVMELYSRLTALEGHVSSDSIEQAGSKPIQPHQHGFQFRYGHLTKASPQLSPPIKVNLLEESSAATSEPETSMSGKGDQK